MSDLHIGSPVHDRRRRFDLPPDIVSLTMAVLGIRGSGKTNTAVVIAEELLDLGHQVVVIDPLDVWWGLKSSRDGTAAGHPVAVFGGPNGDLPLKAEAGKVLADLAVERRMPMVLSLRHLRKGQQREFVTAFAEQLYHRKGEAEHRVPLLVIVDEASSYIPQRVGASEARMVGAMEDLVRRGRAAGIGMVAIDQRAASVNKDVLTQLEVLVAHRTTSPQDRKALQEWIRAHDTEDLEARFMADVASLGLGEAYVWSPRLDVFERVQVRERRTFDSSATPELGQEAALPETWAEVDLEALREQLQETIAEAEANDPKALKARVAELERELRSARNAKPDVDVEAEVQARLEAAVREQWGRLSQAAREGVATALDRVCELAAEIHDPLREIGRSVASVQLTLERMADLRAELEQEIPVPEVDGLVSPLPRQQRRRPTVAAPARPIQARNVEVRDQDHTLTGPQRKILGALAKLEALGLHAPDRGQVGAFSGYSPKSSTFRNYMGQLSTADLIRYPTPGQVQLTDAGRDAAGTVPGPVTLSDLHAAWLGILDGPRGKLLSVVIEKHPRTLTNEELAEAAGYSASSSTYRNYRGTLSSLGLITYPEPGRVAASELLFPEGLHG